MVWWTRTLKLKGLSTGVKRIPKISSSLCNLFEQVEDGLQFLTLCFMRTFLSEAELGGHEGIVDDVEDVRVMIFEEEKSFLRKRKNFIDKKLSLLKL
jgi:hypothetical protein